MLPSYISTRGRAISKYGTTTEESCCALHHRKNPCKSHAKIIWPSIWSWACRQSHSVASAEIVGLLTCCLPCFNFRRSVRSNSTQSLLISQKPLILSVVHPSIHLPACPTIHYLSHTCVSLYVCCSVLLSVHPSDSLSACLSIFPFVHPSVCLSIGLSTCLCGHL